jgi:hypothetical protein
VTGFVLYEWCLSFGSSVWDTFLQRSLYSCSSCLNNINDEVLRASVMRHRSKRKAGRVRVRCLGKREKNVFPRLDFPRCLLLG